MTKSNNFKRRLVARVLTELRAAFYVMGAAAVVLATAAAIIHYLFNGE